MTKKSRGKSDKEKLFEAYSTNLAFYKPEHVGFYGCPLCLRLFGRESLLNGDLTREHIIPSSMGGRLQTLTCRKCNNTSGTNLESHLIQQAKVSDIVSGAVNAPLRAKVCIENIKQTADVYFSGDSSDHMLHIEGVPEQSDPEQTRQIIEALESGVKNFGIQFPLGYKELPLKVAKIRIAYLMMFRQFGYGYILNQHLEPIRNLIREPIEDSPILYGLSRLNGINDQDGIGLVIEPVELKSFICIVILPTTIPQQFGMIFPGFDDVSGSIYDRLKMRKQSNELIINQKVKIYPYNPAYITNPDYAFLPARIWHDVI